jgi:hypothetical protein
MQEIQFYEQGKQALILAAGKVPSGQFLTHLLAIK